MLLEIFSKNKKWLFLTYAILIVEFTLFALMPWLLGKAVDQLIVGNWQTFWFYISCCSVGILIGTGRRLLDTRAFTKIWAKAAVKTIERLVARNVSSPKIMSRRDLVRRYADFYEFTIPQTVSAVIDITIALIILGLAIGLPTGWIAGLLLMSFCSSYFWSCKTQKVEQASQKIREEINHHINDRNEEKMEGAFDVLVDKYIENSDYDAYSWGFTDVMSIAAEIILVMCLIEQEATTGTIMSTITYCWRIFIRANIISWFFMNLKNIEVANDYLNNQD